MGRPPVRSWVRPAEGDAERRPPGQRSAAVRRVRRAAGALPQGDALGDDLVHETT